MDELSLNYHIDQWTSPKESTKKFVEFIASLVKPNSLILDLGCGAGASTAYIANAFPTTKFIGLEINQDLVKIADTNLKRSQIGNLSFICKNILRLPAIKNVSGVTSLHVLLDLPDAELHIKQIAKKLNPDFIALSSLFYDGEISVLARVHQHLRKSGNYNTISLNEFRRIALKYGYDLRSVEDFIMPFPIAKPSSPDFMSTYTANLLLDDGTQRQVQISGPLIMDWKMVLLVRSDFK